MQPSLRSIFEQAAAGLGAALGHHQPCFGPNELGEANAVFHVGLALAQNGFHVYAQCPLEGDGYPRVDLCALSPRFGLLLERNGCTRGRAPGGWLTIGTASASCPSA